MSLQTIFRRAAAASFAAGCLFAVGASAQVKSASEVAGFNNVYCAGYIQTTAVDTSRRIVGAYNEQENHIFSEGNVVYLNTGMNNGVKVGDVMSVTRPRGKVNTKWTNKGSLGFLVDEVGTVEVIRVKSDSSVARVKTSCDNFLLGDLVQPWQARPVPVHTARPALDLYGDPNGKAIGRLFMARGNLETVSPEQIVYIDLGAEDSVRVGDYLTVFRPLGTGNPFYKTQTDFTRAHDESVEARINDYGSFTYKGGEFSNQTARKSGEHAGGSVVTTREAKEGRGRIRKVVGEMIVLNVKERTATAMITRTSQELHTGDYVELQ